MSSPTTSTTTPGHLPPELTYSPVPLVALFGLQPAISPDHALVWDGFTANRQPDRVPMYYKFCSDTDFLPPVKAKKSSYEWFIPKGILKRSWIRKHLFEVPAVAVLFFDLDFDDPEWLQKEDACVAKVDQVRRQLNGRSSRLAVVLIQRSVSLPGDESLASEKAGHLCVRLSLPANCLFVLPVREDANHLHGFFYRMEAAFAELSKSYYQSCMKVVRNHREQLNKTTHQLLFVRHQFKLGFYSELRQDPISATKHYRTGYGNLLEVRCSANNLYEIKTIAGFLCYKISRLCFAGNFPLDAISHFKKHVEVFRSKADSPELEFEHKNWLSKQFAMFASLFEVAVASGLLPSQSQNPGFYYFEAAMEAIARRKIAKRLLAGIRDPPLTSDESVAPAAEEMEFFGQRSWRPGCQAHEILDAEREAAGIRGLQVAEAAVNHSVITIGLLGSAITHFKRNKCHRLRRYMTVLIADEYFSTGDYASTLAALNQSFPAYKHEEWIDISRSILIRSLLSSFYLANGTEFLRLAKDFLESGLAASHEERSAVSECVTQITRNEVPSCLPESWHAHTVPHVTWTFPSENPQTSASESSPNLLPLRFYVGNGSVRCRSLSGHDFNLPNVTMQSHEPAVAPNVPTSPPQSTSVVDTESRQEIGSHAVTGNDLLQVSAVVPGTGTSRTPIQITFTFVNLTLAELPIELSIGNNDNFMFSGNKQINLLLSPGAAQTQAYILYPLVCGYVHLPRLRIVAFPDSPHAQPLDALVESTLPQFIQIMPKGS